MNIAKKIEEKINSIEKGKTFTYKDLELNKEEYSATSKSIELLIKKEIIKRISRGMFYKPKKTVFGELKPDEEKIITPYLFKNGKRIAYITGLLLSNKKGMIRKIVHNYPKIFKGLFDRIRDTLIFEATWHGDFEPFEKGKVSSLIYEMLIEKNQ